MENQKWVSDVPSDLNKCPDLSQWLDEWPAQALLEGARLQGTLVCSEDLYFDAVLDGTLVQINPKAQLIIGPKAKIKGKIIAHAVIIHGCVEGDVIAQSLVTLTSMAFVSGSVLAGKLRVDFGAVIQGQSKSGSQYQDQITQELAKFTEGISSGLGDSQG